MQQLKGLISMGLMAFLSACTRKPTLDYYKGGHPPLDLKEYFTGTIKAWGLVQDRKGHVTRRFDVTMVGTWEGDTASQKTFLPNRKYAQKAKHPAISATAAPT